MDWFLLASYVQGTATGNAHPRETRMNRPQHLLSLYFNLCISIPKQRVKENIITILKKQTNIEA